MTIELDDLLVQVPDGPNTKTLLDHVSLKVDSGSTLVLTGPSGSGKSTLLAVAGLLRTPTAGTVKLNGTDLATVSAKERGKIRRDHVGIAFQSPNLFPSLTARDQIRLVAHIEGEHGPASDQAADDILEKLGLTDRADARPHELSGGERQRVNIARALAREPDVLLLDEPTASLDDERGRDVLRLVLEETARRGAATLLVTHNLGQLPGGLPRVILDGGRLVDAPATPD